MKEIAYRSAVIGCNIVGGLAAGFGGAYAFSSGYWGPGLILAGTGLLAVPPIIALTTTIRRAGLDIRDSALGALTELGNVFLNLTDDCDSRVTLHRVDENVSPAVLKAVARGGRDKKVPKSTMTIHQGVAGLCYRQKALAHKPEISDFTKDMRDLGFTDQDIRQFQADRKSYLCVPVIVGGAVVAVISCDSKKPNVFEAQQEAVAQRLTPFFATLLNVEENARE